MSNAGSTYLANGVRHAKWKVLDSVWRGWWRYSRRPSLWAEGEGNSWGDRLIRLPVRLEGGSWKTALRDRGQLRKSCECLRRSASPLVQRGIYLWYDTALECNTRSVPPPGYIFLFLSAAPALTCGFCNRECRSADSMSSEECCCDMIFTLLEHKQRTKVPYYMYKVYLR